MSDPINTDVKDRFKFLVNSYIKNLLKVNNGLLAQSLNLSKSNLSNILNSNKNQKVSLETISKILRLYPEVNIKWLILGEGDMLNRTNFNKA